jgi:ADP-dependent phosphofructokinase/glucokinase
MSNSELKKIWLEKFKEGAKTLKRMKEVSNVAVAFNTNIDAVIKIKPAKFYKLLEAEDLSLDELRDIRESKLKSGADVVKGIFRCFSEGIAEEWLTDDVTVYDWMVANIGYDRLQIGGQGGVVSNALGVAGVSKVFVHTNSLPKLQADQFLKLDNVLSFDEKGKEMPAYQIDRSTDIPLIHWIIEFDKGDVFEIEGHKFTCPKSNRFIATYDPLNFNLVMDNSFVEKMKTKKLDYIFLSGFHALTADNKGVELVEEALPIIETGRKSSTILHLEIASTQDVKVRKAIVEKLAPFADSVGCNERETIDVLEVIGEKELAEQCEESPHSVNLFKGIMKIKEKTKCKRIQLHMFGLYVVVQDKDFSFTPEANLRGMEVAALAAASKAGLGAINKNNDILWASGREVSDTGLNELRDLAEFIGDEKFLETGICEYKGYDIISLPTILIDKPLTTVGLGDTISSLSLVSAR